MNGFIDSFKPLFIRYKSEAILLICAFLIGVTSFVFFLEQKNSVKKTEEVSVTKETRTTNPKSTSTVDVSGAVKNPFVYTFDSHARIIDAIQKAGGLTEDADSAFVKRSINLARIINDQEKIYIPFISDVTDGYIVETKRVIDYTQPNINSLPEPNNSRININTASAIELDQLPGIGQVLSESIFNGRPYSATEDLVKKSIIKQSVYDKIKDLISIY